MNPSRFLAVLRARNKEFWRDRSTLAWNVAFPVLVVLGFAFAFSGDNLQLYKVGLIGASQDNAQLEFLHTEHLQFIPVSDPDAAKTRVARHQLDMLLDIEQKRFWVNESSPHGYLLERVLKGTGGGAFDKQLVNGREVRYVDWLLPGVLAMNMMFSALFGVGYVIVRYRKNGVLKRLKATPLSALEFLTAQILSRLWLILGVTVLVYVGCDWLIGFTMHGSYLDLFILFALGTFSIISLGLIIAARTASEELASGLLNLLSWPMMFLSGVWFSLEGLHPYVRGLAQLFPLTHLIEGARAIMIDGASLADISGQLLVLGAMSAVFLAIGAYSFRWQ
jgi:ABC-type polysaccharide/polyol phosphate export permease